jgi:uncharacterized alpha-E superfamily protein
MIRGQGWRFLETGRRIERAQITLGLLRAAIAGPTMLPPLLEICDSVMTYRRRYFSSPEWKGVQELLFHDGSNPRSVGFQLAVLRRESENFPGDPQIIHLKVLSSYIGTSASPNLADLQKLTTHLAALSELVTQYYFSHSERRVY